MTKRVLTFFNINAAPMSNYVIKGITGGLQKLLDAGALELDFTGRKTGDYRFEFFTGNKPILHIGCWYPPTTMGVSGTTDVYRIKKNNYCTDVTDCKTCQPIYRHTESELGRALVNTTLHELGHMFGLIDKASYAGADNAGHTSDINNPMFDGTRDKDYRPYKKDFKRSTKYTVKQGDTLSKIAQRIGFQYPYATWKDLYNFKGKDNTINRDILRSKDPEKIYPGEQIWIPDINAIIAHLRKVECIEKLFTQVQISLMSKRIEQGWHFFKTF
jgi:hypothetical protein